MFMPCSDESVVAESAIVAFCAALNTPVVNIDALEVGPARAGIMIAADESSELNLLVRVCLISSGEGVTFKFQGDPTEFRDSAAAIHAALSFSEGMGFLFEEDLLAGGGPAGRQRAIKIWKSLCGLREEAQPDLAAAVSEESSPTVAPNRPGPEAELSDAVGDVMPPVSIDRRVSALGSPLLTKFRRGPPSEGDAAAVGGRRSRRQETNDPLLRPGSKEFGRVKLGSEKSTGEGPDGSGFLTKLLSSFWVSN
jgi:hypothetical protein